MLCPGSKVRPDAGKIDGGKRRRRALLVMENDKIVGIVSERDYGKSNHDG